MRKRVDALFLEFLKKKNLRNNIVLTGGSTIGIVPIGMYTVTLY